MRFFLVGMASLLLILGLASFVLVSGLWRPSFPAANHALGSWLRGAAQTPAMPRKPAAVGLPSGTTVANATPKPVAALPVETPAPSAQVEASQTPVQEAAVEQPTEVPWLPITRVEVPRLGLHTDVGPAPIVQVPGGTTWDVPPFVAGHGEHTAGAGQPGNAVLLGHVVSPTAGSVFKDVSRMQRGDAVKVFSGDREFDYAVKEIRTVPRTDLSVLAPTDEASVTLLTCTGAWLPALQDYSHRLAVRGELVSPSNAR